MTHPFHPLARPLGRSDSGPDAITADYEALRSAVLQQGVGGPRLARAVIDRAGMVAWMEAWSAAPPAPTSTAADSVLVRSAAGTEVGRSSPAWRLP